MNHWIKIFQLSRVLSWINFSFMNVRHKLKERPSSYTVILTCFLVSLSGFLYYHYVQMVERLYVELADLGMDVLFCRIVLFFLTLLVLLIGALLMMDLFCFSNDVEYLLLFPVLPYHLLTSKYLLVAVFCCVVEVVLMIPACIIQTRYTGDLSVIVTYLSVVFLIPALTVFPLAFVATVCLKIAMMVKRLRTVWVVGGLVICLMSNAVYRILFARWYTGTEKDVMSAYWALTTPFPFYDQYVHWNIGLKLCAILLFAGVVALYSCLSRMIIGKNYIVYSNVRCCGSGQIAYRSSGKLMSYFRKECKTFFRNPLYVLNGLFGVVVTPFLLPLSFKIGTTAESTEQIRQMVAAQEFSLYATVLALAVVVLTASINVVAASSFSREGANYWIVQMIPYTFKQQAYVKILFSTVVSVVGIAINCVIFKWYFHYEYGQILVIALIGTCFVILWNCIGVFIDMKHPKLTWNNEAEAVQQNVNVVTSIILCVVLSLVYLFCVTKMMQMALPSYLILGSVLGSLIILIALINRGISKHEEHFYVT